MLRDYLRKQKKPKGEIVPFIDHHYGWEYSYTPLYVTWLLGGIATYLYISYWTIVKINDYFEDYEFNTKSQGFENLYYRIVYNTEYISLPKFLTYSALNLIGFTFIQVVPLCCERYSFITDQWGKTDGFFKLGYAINPVIFMLSMNICMRGKNDLQGYCDPNAVHKAPVTAQVNLESIKDPMMQLFGTVH